MNERTVQRRVGLFVIATVVTTGVLIALTSKSPLGWTGGTYPVTIAVDRAPGVGPKTPVRRDGVLIGRVSRTESIRGGVLLWVDVNRGEVLYTTDAIRIRPSSLFGDAVIDISQTGGGGPSPPIVQEGQQLQGAAMPDPIEALTALQVDVGPAIKSLGQAGDEVSRLADRLNTALGEDIGKERVARMLDDAISALNTFEVTMAKMSTTIDNVDALFGDPQVQQDFRRALAAVPGVVEKADKFLDEGTRVVGSLDGAVTSLQNNLEAVEGLTRPLGERGGEIVRLLNSALENLDLVLVDAKKFALGLNNTEGTLGQLLNDRKTYDNVNTVICNANLVVLRLDELLKQARPILNDARAFTDKVGREPGRLIRGAADPSFIK
ncbi:hypothetical protein Pla175_12480 [Pirellulimonas nuda]|uniref:Mce/MlaD domain-containing protein n=1 Tax=Pirellulimonas nuda TaxID=2528009 RepID=A0A518D8S2_9BACT|nr:MlaD family protein [Pirellulimonas nuda]QDU87881.1 hypothetical protein Pla175_12480 [Pirellulimonas nuda]